MKIAYLYNPKHLDIHLIRKKECPTDYGYGAFELQQAGHEVDFVEINLWSSRDNISKILYFFLRYFVPALTTKKFKYEYAIECTRLLAKLNSSYDAIVCIPQKMTLMLSFFKRLNLINPVVFGIQTGAINYPDNIYQRLILSFFYNSIHSIVLGEGEHREMVKRYFLKRDHIHYIPFGVDTSFWKFEKSPSGEKISEPYILSVGSDYYRDYSLLLKVAKEINYKIIILSGHDLCSEGLPNVEIIKGSAGRPALSFIELKRLYENAICLVTPVKNCWQPSGQSSSLQAMACGTPVIIANYKGLWCRNLLLSLKSVLLYRVNDVCDCKKKILDLISCDELRLDLRKNGLSYVNNYVNSKKFSYELGILMTKFK